MANDQERGSPEDLGQDPYVERRRPHPSQPPEHVRILEGLLGDSEREGYKRLYFTRELDHYAEFRVEDVVFSETIPPDQPPFLGLEATRVGLRHDATIEYTRVRTPKLVDEFDLDVRLADPRAGVQRGFGGRDTEFIGPICQRTVPPTECIGVPCDTDFGHTCPIRRCGLTRGVTCPATQCNTCQTCQTCQTQCQNTCQTCQTRCGQFTCFDDDTCLCDPTFAVRCPTNPFRCRTDEPNCPGG